MRVVVLDVSGCLGALHAIKLGMRAAGANFSREEFDFYGITFRVEEDSDPDLLLREWARAYCGCLGDHPVIGPYPPEELTPDQLENDARIIASQPQDRIYPESASNFLM